MQASLYPMIIHRTQEMYDRSLGKLQNVTNLYQVYHINDIGKLSFINEFFTFSASKQVRSQKILDYFLCLYFSSILNYINNDDIPCPRFPLYRLGLDTFTQ